LVGSRPQIEDGFGDGLKYNLAGVVREGQLGIADLVVGDQIAVVDLLLLLRWVALPKQMIIIFSIL
jgi:hypothetical protein